MDYELIQAALTQYKALAYAHQMDAALMQDKERQAQYEALYQRARLAASDLAIDQLDAERGFHEARHLVGLPDMPNIYQPDARLIIANLMGALDNLMEMADRVTRFKDDQSRADLGGALTNANATYTAAEKAAYSENPEQRVEGKRQLRLLYSEKQS